MRILFSFIGGLGHLRPLIPLARAAEAAGHEVAVAGSGTRQADIRSMGFTAFSTSPERMPTTGELYPLKPVDLDAERSHLREGFARKGAARHATEITRIGRDWMPDLIVRDEVDLGSAIAAEVLGVPCVSVVVLMAGGFLTKELVAEPIAELRAAHGLPADPELATLDGALTLYPGPASLPDPRFPLPANVRHLQPAALPSRSGGDRIYLSLGTLEGHPDLLRRLLLGLRDLGRDVIVTTGNIDPADLGPQPAHVQVERFVPQEEILPTCALVVSHGGSGTVLGTLAAGLPALILPRGADQPYNARRCVELGLARSLDAVTATPEQVYAAAHALLTEPGARQAAGRIREEIAALPPVASAVPVLEALTRRR